MTHEDPIFREVAKAHREKQIKIARARKKRDALQKKLKKKKEDK